MFIVSRVSLILIVLFLLSGCDDKVVLLSDLSERDANEVVGELLSSGLEAEKVITKTGVTIMINQKAMSRAVVVLKVAGLPNQSQTSLGEVFKKEGVISTPLEERARYIYALSQELEFTLSQIDGVLISRVHVVLPERVAPGQPIQPSSAAVFIKHRPELDPDVIEPQIYRMVSSSIPGLSEANRDKISVAFVESVAATDPVEWEKVGPFMVQQESATSLRRLFMIAGVLYLVLLFFLVRAYFRGKTTWSNIKQQAPMTENSA